jgi:hypothetical protein
MKLFGKSVSTAATITAAAIIAASGISPLAAQDKTNTQIQLIRNVDEPGFNAFKRARMSRSELSASRRFRQFPPAK